MDETIRTAAISPLRQRLIDDMNVRRFQIEPRDTGVAAPTMDSIVAALRSSFTRTPSSAPTFPAVIGRPDSPD